MLSERLRNLLNSRGISLAEFAEMCDLPLETVKNIYYGKTTDPKVSTLMKMGNVLDLSVNCLMGQCLHPKDEQMLLGYYRMCGEHGKSLILLTSKYEAVSAKAEREAVGKHKIPCLIANGNMSEGIIYDNCETTEITTTTKEAFVAIKLTTNDLVPAYCKGDIILIKNCFPKEEEYVVFYKGERAYIRKFTEENGKYILKGIHNIGEDILLKRMDEVEYIGTCIGVVRA